MADEEERVETMEDDSSAQNTSRRRMPRRAASTDAAVIPKRKINRSKTGDPSSINANRAKSSSPSAIRRTATDASAISLRKGRKPGSNKSTETDGSQRDSPKRTLPSRSKSGSIGPPRTPPKRTGSGFAALQRTGSGFGGLPRRTKSSDGTSRLGIRKGRKKEKAGSSEDTRNIFGSDLVSTQKILDDIQECMEATSVTRLELEDFFVAERDDPEAIPLKLKQLLECDDRPWEYVQYLDDIMDGSMYPGFRERKRNFLRTLAGVCETKLIPVSYKAKITIASGNMTMDEMMELLFHLRADKSIVELTLKSENVDQGVIRGLVELFKADKRKWKSVTLQLSGTGPGKAGSPEHKKWAKEMQAASEEMQKVCKERGINLG